MRTPSKVRNKARDKKALERAILRRLRATSLVSVGTLSPDTQAVLYGLERARREL